MGQFGGYTGITPANLHDRLYHLAAECHFPANGLLLG
ncbi:class II D-tagatose-bisphosphate aldolase non-catalytic subunit [Aeromonas allosaccharophila]